MSYCARSVVTNALDALGLTQEELEEGDLHSKERVNSKGVDKRICECGHSFGRHTSISRFLTCKPNAMTCLCKRKRLVGYTSDTRLFLKKTEGSAGFHALGRGIKAIEKAAQAQEAAGEEVTKFFNWVVKECDRCKEDKPLSPTAVSNRGVSVDHETGYNSLLCYECRVGN